LISRAFSFINLVGKCLGDFRKKEHHEHKKGTPRGGWIMLDEEAKAVQEVAKTTGKAIEAGRELGGFFSKILGEGFYELGESFRLNCGLYKYKQFLKVADKVEEIHRQRRLEGKSIPIPPSRAIPIIENACIEEDESIQDLWARLIANATDPERRFQVRKIFIQLLSSLEPLDVMIIRHLSNQGRNVFKGPHSQGFNCERLAKELNAPICNIQISLLNLWRLGCLEGAHPLYVSTEEISSGLNVNDPEIGYALTFLGVSLLEACKE
jgi:hypothetical protein